MSFTLDKHKEEHIISKVFRKHNLHKELKERWKRMNYRPPVPEQLEMFANAPTHHAPIHQKR